MKEEKDEKQDKKDRVVTAFKDCDVRGIYPEEVYEELVEAAGYGFAKDVVYSTNIEQNEGGIILAGDARVSTPSLKKFVIKGLMSHPVKVLDLGTVPTNIAYWAKEKKNAQGLAIVTASHNPPNFNGLKIMNGEFPPLPSDIAAFAQYIGCNTCLNEEATLDTWPEVVDEYKKEIVETFKGNISGLKIVIDPGNGCLSNIASDVYRVLGAEVISINDFRDGLFPGRLPDCAVPSNLNDLREKVLDNEADFGVAFDGDGDRIALIDNEGNFVRTEHLAMLLLKDILRNKVSERVIIDVKCSLKLEKLIEKLNCVPVRCKSGHAFMKREVLYNNAIMGAELSGHIFLRELNGRDDPLFVSLRLASIMSKSSNKLSEEIQKLPEMYMTNDVRVSITQERIAEIIEGCRTAFGDARVDTLDGTRVVMDNGWILARRSITEPKITIRLEGETYEDLREISQKFISKFKDLGECVSNAVNIMRKG